MSTNIKKRFAQSVPAFFAGALLSGLSACSHGAGAQREPPRTGQVAAQEPAARPAAPQAAPPKDAKPNGAPAQGTAAAPGNSAVTPGTVAAPGSSAVTPGAAAGTAATTGSATAPDAGSGNERSRRLLDEALLTLGTQEKLGDRGPDELVQRFGAAAREGKSFPAQLDYAVALDRKGALAEAEKSYREAAALGEAPKALLALAAERAAALAVVRGDAKAAREAVELVLAREPGVRALALKAEVELALGDLAAAQSAARTALAQAPADVRSLCVLARVHAAQGSPGTALLLANRAAAAAPHDARPLLVQTELARAAGDQAKELDAARAAAVADPNSADAALALGRVLFEHGQLEDSLEALDRAVELAPSSAAAHYALGAVLASDQQYGDAVEELTLASSLAPSAAAPHLELARVKLDGDNDAQLALNEAKIFLKLSPETPPSGHPVHSIVQRCEEALAKRTQASVVQKP